MAKGGARPGAGRPIGAASKLDREARKKAAESGIMPLDYLLELLRNEFLPSEDRFKAAVAAAPYLHAKLSSVEHSGDPDNPQQHIHRIERIVIGNDSSKG